MEKDGERVLEITPDALSRMVKDSQISFLSKQGGTSELAKQLGCVDINAGLGENFNFEMQRKKFGRNYFDIAKTPSYLSLILEGAQDKIIILLTIAAIVSLAIGVGFAPPEERKTAWIEGASILLSVAIVLNVQALTEYRKAKSFKKQQELIEGAKQVNVIRGGKTFSLHPKELVVGDIIRVALGDIVQADGVLVDGFSVKMDESPLTGESKLMEKAPFNPGQQVMSKEHMKESPFILSGTMVMDGQGRMLVAAVGTNSLQGKILSAVLAHNNSSAPASELPPSTEQEVQVVVGSSKDEAQTPEEQTNETKNPQRKRNRVVRCCVSFFTFGDIDSGGTLIEKLDHLAIDIGKLGIIVASIVFVVLTIRFCITEFGADDFCSTFKTNNECKSQINSICDFNQNSNTCYRKFTGPDFNQILIYFITAITILVVAIPEGLPLAVTLSLAISMQKMAKDNNQVKHLEACETMGSATTVCSDKTGTLTENRMTVMRVAVGSQIVFMHDSVQNKSVGRVIKDSSSISESVKKMIAESICLNSLSTSSVEETSPGTWKYLGNATECALLKLSSQIGFKAETIRQDLSYSPEVNSSSSDLARPDWGVFYYPFSSSRKRMSWVVTYGKGYRLFTKGAPNVIFDACTRIFNPSNNSSTSTIPFDLLNMEKIVDSYQNDAMRAIAIGYKDFDRVPSEGWLDPKIEMSGITLLCVVAIEDPLRPAVIKAIRQCNSAGVDVRMCTGDALPTAIAISKQCQILRNFDLDVNGNPKPLFAMTGAEFDERVHFTDVSKPKILRRAYNFSDKKAGDFLAHPFLCTNDGEKILNQKAFDSIWPKLRVLARCQPEDKLTLVKGLRSSKLFANFRKCDELLKNHNIDIFPDFQVVAVTGDGTNDAPALKAANVGFAMGIVGTDIAKSACDIVLLDDNFASIVAAVKWGRNVFDAISKFIQFQLTVNICAITLAALGAFLFDESPLRAVQMLWVNLIMDSLASVALATEPPTEMLLQRKPYGKRRPIISRPMIMNMVFQAAYQLCVLFLILYHPEFFFTGADAVEKYPPDVFNGNQPQLQSNNRRELSAAGDPSTHWTIVFNVFVLMTLVNQVNSRKLPEIDRLKTDPWEWCVFTGLLLNPFFLVILAFEAILHVIIIEFCGPVFTLVFGLSTNQWLVCVAFAFGGFIWQLFIYLIMVVTDPYFANRNARALRNMRAKANLEAFVKEEDELLETLNPSQPPMEAESAQDQRQQKPLDKMARMSSKQYDFTPVSEKMSAKPLPDDAVSVNLGNLVTLANPNTELLGRKLTAEQKQRAQKHWSTVRKIVKTGGIRTAISSKARAGRSGSVASQGDFRLSFRSASRSDYPSSRRASIEYQSKISEIGSKIINREMSSEPKNL